MSDKPKPGKDKDLRYIRQAMDETQQLFALLGQAVAQADDQTAERLAAMMLLVLEQLDLLDQMFDLRRVGSSSRLSPHRSRIRFR